MKYQITGFMKLSQLDNWDKGCGLEYRECYIQQSLTATTIPELIQKCLDFTRGELLPELIAPNRLEFQAVENSEGVPASDLEMEQFRRGEIDLWLCNYSCLVDTVQAADLTDYFDSVRGS